MSSNSDDIQAAGSDTRPPMLDMTDYESWSQRIRLYCRGKENRLQILQFDQGPFELGTTRNTLGTTPEEGVLLGPERPRTYDDLSDNEKKRYDTDVRATNIVLQGLPKDIYKLINHNIEAKAIWDNVEMLLAAVKLNKGLKETTHEQLCAYWKQHEKHAAQDWLIIEKITPTTNDPLAFVSNYPQLTETSQLDSGYTQTDEILDNLTKQMALLTQSFRNQNQRYFARGNGTAGNGGAQNRAGNANADYFKDKMLLMQAQENGVVLDEEELLFLAGEQANTFNADVDNQPVQDLALNEDNIFQADECDAFDSDVDDEPTAQSIFMANLSSVGPANLQADPSNASILSEVHILENAIDHSVTNQDEHEIHNEVQQANVIDSTSVDMGNSNVIPYEQYLSVNNVSVVPICASSALTDAYVLFDNDVYVPHDPIATELKIYKEQVAIYKQRAKFELPEREQRMDDQMRMLIQNRNQTEENLKKELHSVKLQLNSTMENNKIIGETNPSYLRKAKVAQPALYDGDEILKPDHVPVSVTSSEEGLVIAEITRQKMNEKMNDPVMCFILSLILLYMYLDFMNYLLLIIVELEAENSKLLEQIQNDDHNTMVKNFSKLEVARLNLQLKYQHLKENIENFKSKPSKDVPEFDAFFEISNWDAQIQDHINIIRVRKATKARRSKSKSNTINDKTLPSNSVPEKQVEDHHRKNKSKLSKTNRVDSSTSIRRTVFNTNSNSLCRTCNECNIAFNHDKCVVNSMKSSKPTPIRKIWRVKQVKQTWKPTRKVFTTVGYQWKPTGKAFTTVVYCWKPTGRILPLAAQCPLTRNTKPKVLPVRQWKPTGRLFSLGGQYPLVRNTALTSGTMLVDLQANNNLVEDTHVCTNQQDPNCNWGSNLSYSPFSSLFKCRSYRSFFGIWTQAAQNI
ncbi:hypothetical protein Tco_0791330 [Tanacetum coccineum]